MADNEETSFKIDLDSEGFVNSANEAYESIMKIGEADNLKGLLKGLEAAGPLLGVIAVAFIEVKTIFESVFDAEKIAAVNQEFEILTDRAGIFSNTLKEGLEKSAHGLVTETELLEATNKALIELQVGAEKLPQIMNLARQASQINGQTMIQNFESITRAIATGNTRMLRQLNIVIDQKKAWQDFAASIGVGVSALSLAGKQQAVLNATLEAGSKQLKGIDGDIKIATNSWQQFKVSITEIKETFATMISESIAGQATKSAIKYLSDSVHALSISLRRDAGDGMELLGNKSAYLSLKLTEARKNMMELQHKATKWGDPSGMANNYIAELSRAKVVYQDLLKQNSAITAEIKKQKDVSKEKTSAVKGTPSLVDKNIILKDKNALNKELIALDEKRIKSEEDLETNAANLAKLREQEYLNIEKKAANEIDEINRKLSSGEISDKKLAKAQIVSISKKADQDITASKIKAKDDAIKAAKELELAEEKTMKGFTGGWQVATATGAKNFQNMATLGEKANSGLTNSMTAGFKAIGDGSQDAATAMGQAFLGEIGQEATSRGEFLLASSIWPPNPLGLAAGGALVALGSKLSSMGSSSSSSVSSGVSAGGGSASSAAPSAASSPLTSAASQTVSHQSTNLVFNGPILSDATTQRWITDAVRGAADAQNFTVQSVGGGF